MADELVDLRIEKVVAGGDGLGRDADGRVVFTAAALPGERVLARVTEARRDLAHAVIHEVLEPSPLRRSPPCPHVGSGCGGCGWQHVAPAAQLDLKVGIVREALARTGRLPDAEVAAGEPLPSAAVRTTVRLAADERGRFGFRAARSHRVVAVTSCFVAHPLVAELLPELRVETNRRSAAAAPAPIEVALRVGVASGERSAHVTTLAAARSSARRRGRSGPRRTTSADVRLTGLPADVAVGPDAMVHEVVAGHRFRVSAAAFFQSSPEGAEALVAAVRRAAGDLATTAAHAVDAYAGGGLFAATVFGPAVRVTAVEASPAACADARTNVVDATVREMPVETWRPEPADLVVADPARAGLGRAGATAVAGTGAARIVLVSCDPVAMARDARLLAEAGYRHAGSEVFDLFPHTSHVEVVSRFDRC